MATWQGNDGTIYEGTALGTRYARRIVPFVNVRDEGEACRLGFNFYPLRRWGGSRGFILNLGRWRYYCRWSVHQHRLIHGWEKTEETTNG